MIDSPFAEDTALCAIAARFGLDMQRYESIEITDEAAIQRAGLMRETPDYPRIRRALADGGEVAGARLAGVQYTLKRRETAVVPPGTTAVNPEMLSPEG